MGAAVLVLRRHGPRMVRKRCGSRLTSIYAKELAMDRSTRYASTGYVSKRGVATWLCAGAVLTAAIGGVAGCNAVATALWVIKDGKTASAEYKGLNNKKVAV